MIVISLLVLNNAKQIHQKNLRLETEVTAEQIKLRLESWVDNRIAILEYLANSEHISPQNNPDVFIEEALKVQGLYPGFQAINWIDPEMVITIVTPEATNLAAKNVNLNKHPDPAVPNALRSAIKDRSICRSPMIHLLQGKPGFATYLPLWNHDGSSGGCLNGVFVMEKVVESCLGPIPLKNRFAMEIVTLSGNVAYQYIPDVSPLPISNTSAFSELGLSNIPEAVSNLKIRIVDKNWEISLLPLAAINRPLLLTGEGWLFIAGLTLASALSLLLRAYLLRILELRESQSNYKLMVDHQVDMLVKVDDQLKLVFVSPSAIKKIGLPKEDILGKKTIEFIHPEDHLKAKKYLQILTENPTEHLALVVRLKNNDSWMWTSWAGSNIFNESGEFVGLVIVGRDITEERELESRLRQGQKLQAVGQLAGGVAHDFNNIIQAILGYLDFVKADLPQESDSYKDLTQAELAAERAASLTRQLLAFSRRQMLQPVVLNLNSITRDLLPMLRRLLGESIDLKFSTQPSLPSVKADQSQIEQILVNLCVNARDSISEETGQISIETSQVTLDEKFCRLNPWAEPGQWICLSLTDSGCGMEEEILTQIFEPFFTTKETGKGTGLGLATVYGIIKQHEGLLHVTSSPGQGSQFQIYLRTVTEVASENGSQPLHEPVVGFEKILLVEDEEMVRNLTCRLLESSGYQVVVAENGVQAYKLWREKNQEFDLVLMDVVMPLMGGRELSKKIKQDSPEMRIIFMSGYDSESFISPVDRSDPSDLLLKPFDRITLLEKVRDLLDR
ncbi:MAG: response regulator [bacterium]|nr:response regulator [bacterium]